MRPAIGHIGYTFRPVSPAWNDFAPPAAQARSRFESRPTTSSIRPPSSGFGNSGSASRLKARTSSIMNNRITFARFDAVLEELGFKKTVIPTSHVNYRHEASDTLLMIRLHQPDDFVPDYVMTSTQLQ